ncbi:hypothetical protein V1477_018009 [Vespula maculifrons]|uniref:Uncharacterized protein n=1 Tax=Vespula maculifrons TaxID=7453 RepID=A0ABD2B0F6_VESMC
MIGPLMESCEVLENIEGFGGGGVREKKKKMWSNIRRRTGLLPGYGAIRIEDLRHQRTFLVLRVLGVKEKERERVSVESGNKKPIAEDDRIDGIAEIPKERGSLRYSFA